MLDGRAVPVLIGPSRGNRIVVGSGDHAYWVGNFERWKQDFIARLLREGDVFYDLGAHVGFFTLLGAKLVGSTGKVISVEPMPGNLIHLRAHIRVNHFEDRVRVIEAAASDVTGQARFKMHEKTPMGRLDDSGDIAPSVVKMDIEGAEPEALLGMRNLVLAAKPIMVISPHDTDDACVSLLEGWGYAVKSHRGDLIAWPKDRPRPLNRAEA
jgi:hypothetical protein